MTFSKTQTPPFDYAEQPPNLWPAILDELKTSASSSVLEIAVPVRWSAHESIQGVRDFTKQSRLRIEKLFALAAERKISVSLQLGFSSPSKSFPEWTAALPKTALLSSIRTDEGASVFFQTEFPSLENPELRSHFLGFLNDVFLLASLYTGPEGPVRAVEIDLSCFEEDASVHREIGFVRHLEKRHGDIARLNALYRATFKDFSAASQEQGLRICGERRPWLAAFDYKFCSHGMMDTLKAEILALTSASALSEKIRFTGPANSLGNVRYLIDTTLVGLKGGLVYPFAPSGYPSAPSILAFRLVRSLFDHLGDSSFVQSLDPVKPEETLGDSVIVVVAGQYLSRAQMGHLKKVAAAGSRILFPFGYPHYDEQMNTVSWQHKRVQTKEGTVFLRTETEHGEFFAPGVSIGYGATLWQEVDRIYQALVKA